MVTKSWSDFPRYDGPENWKDDQTVARITVEADREDITWISGRIHEDVDRGLIVNISTATKGEHSILLDTTIVAAVISPVITKALDLLVADIQKRINRNKKTEAASVATPAALPMVDRPYPTSSPEYTTRQNPAPG